MIDGCACAHQHPANMDSVVDTADVNKALDLSHIRFQLM